MPWGDNVTRRWHRVQVSKRDEQRTVVGTWRIDRAAPIRNGTCAQTDAPECPSAQEDDVSAIRVCPSCRCADVPHLIVRFGDYSDAGLSWRCRECLHEWSDALGVRAVHQFEAPMEPVPSSERACLHIAAGIPSPYLV